MLSCEAAGSVSSMSAPAGPLSPGGVGVAAKRTAGAAAGTTSCCSAATAELTSARGTTTSSGAAVAGADALFLRSSARRASAMNITRVLEVERLTIMPRTAYRRAAAPCDHTGPARGEALRFYGSGHKPSANRSGLHVYTGAAEEQQLALRSLRPNLLEPLRARGWRTELAMNVVTAPERVSELQSMILSHRAGLGEDIRIRISNESSSSQVHDPPPRPRACPLAPTHAVKFRSLVPLAQVDAALLAWDWALREWIGRSELAAVVMLRIDLVLKQPILRLPDPWMARKPDAPVVTLFGAKYGAVCEKPALDASSKPWHARVVDLFFFVPVYHIAAFRHAMELQCNATAMLARFGTPPGQTCCYGPMALPYTGLALAPVRVTPYLRNCFDANSLIEQNPFYRIAQRDESRQNTRVAPLSVSYLLLTM